ncbi:MAG TPA: hypothetical protein VHU91_04000 [Mycobacteriales bacterium]|nr:hypothetical protein [Mycobacteriales bacterium]
MADSADTGNGPTGVSSTPDAAASGGDSPTRRLKLTRGGVILAAGGAGLVSGFFRGSSTLRQIRQVLA